MTVRTAWDFVLRTPEGQIILTDILRRAYRFNVTNDPDQRVLQQFAIETEQVAGLLPDPGSFPFDYVSTLVKTKLRRPGFFARLVGRLFRRKIRHV